MRLIFSRVRAYFERVWSRLWSTRASQKHIALPQDPPQLSTNNNDCCDVETAQSLEASTTYQQSQQESLGEVHLPAGLPDMLPLSHLLYLSDVDAEVDSSLIARAASEFCSKLLPDFHKTDRNFLFDFGISQSLKKPDLDFLHRSQQERRELYEVAQREHHSAEKYALQAARLAFKHCEQTPLSEVIHGVYNTFALWLFRRTQIRYNCPLDRAVIDQECYTAFLDWHEKGRDFAARDSLARKYLSGAVPDSQPHHDLLWVDGCDRKHPLLKRLADDFLSMFDPATDSLEIEAQRSLRWSERSRAYSNSLDRVLERTDQFYREGQQHAQAHKKYNYDMGMITADYEETLLRLALVHARLSLRERTPTIAEDQLHEQMLAWFSCRTESYIALRRDLEETIFRAPEDDKFGLSRELGFKRQAFDKALFDDDDKHVRAVIELRKKTSGALAFYQ